ncbi:M23 family metallopeptidase [Marilutibacter spongiae]|uniref:M23 family metallopeptidase n=1 Tax=Marilutibacter spongiae TaxID=2025720 RepID=A0A7W3Y6Y9_9GAMM|nr:M23 family metallopeptidase [Lysobacter spongiae]MBB1061604.1 M23 family metallopeptidase [Lysobacter spongiae]
MLLVPGLLLAGALVAGRGESLTPSIPHPPIAASVEGRQVLSYELRLANRSAHALDPRAVEVRAGDAVLARYAGERLEARLDRSGSQQAIAAATPIPPGGEAVVFIDIALDAGDMPPAALEHRIEVGARDTDGDMHVQRIEGASAPVSTAIGSPLSPPLRGGPWVAVSDSRWPRGHRRVGYAVDGRLRTPGRHAVDWARLDADGRRSPEGATLAREAYSHGEDVLAVADARVALVRDEVPERSRLDDVIDRARARREGSGNTVVLDLGDGRFAHFAHLRPGSIVVAKGDRVARGDKIAEVGFSGGASAPQLHFAITDAVDEHASEGLPFHFDAFELSGRYADPSRAGSEPWTAAGAAAGTRRDEMPARGAVVVFDAQH